MGRPTKSCEKFEFKKSFDSMAEFEDYSIKKKLSVRWRKSEKRRSCKVCRLSSLKHDHQWAHKNGFCANISCNMHEQGPKQFQLALCSKTGRVDLYDLGKHNSKNLECNIHVKLKK